MPSGESSVCVVPTRVLPQALPFHMSLLKDGLEPPRLWFEPQSPLNPSAGSQESAGVAFLPPVEPRPAPGQGQ